MESIGSTFFANEYWESENRKKSTGSLTNIFFARDVIFLENTIDVSEHYTKIL